CFIQDAHLRTNRDLVSVADPASARNCARRIRTPPIARSYLIHRVAASRYMQPPDLIAIRALLQRPPSSAELIAVQKALNALGTAHTTALALRTVFACRCTMSLSGS